MNKILCFVNRKLVEEDIFLSEFEKATNGMEFYKVEHYQELISTLGYQNVNGVEFEIVNLEDKKIVIYDNSIEYDKENDVYSEINYTFNTFEEFIESLEYNIEVAMEYDLEEGDIEEMSVELALEYALESIFLDYYENEYIVNGFIYKVEDIEE